MTIPLRALLALSTLSLTLLDPVPARCARAAPEPRAERGPAAAGTPRLPRPLPDVTLLNLDAEPVPLREFKGNVLLLDFWSTGCAACTKRMPELEKLQRERRDAGLVVVGASIDTTAAAVQRFIDGRPVTYPVLLDLGASPARVALGVRDLPATFLVSRGGRIVRQWSGKIDRKKLTAAVDSLLAAEPAPRR